MPEFPLCGQTNGGRPVLAISVRQPWAWAIFHALKDIENRTWKTAVRGVVAIHASSGMTRSEYSEFEAFRKLRGLDGLPVPAFEELTRGAILGTVEIVDCVTHSPSQWFQGCYGFVLKNPSLLSEPIPFKGQLGFFPLPEDVVKVLQAKT